MGKKVPNFIARIEGHARLIVDFDKDCLQLEVSEGERFIETLVVGHKLYEATFITARICGVCPTAHTLTSIKALEAALGVTPSETTIGLRGLLMYSQLIQSHLLHLYFLALPDYAGTSGGIELLKGRPDDFNRVLRLRKVYGEVLTLIGGRAIHPITPVVGGFSKYPSKEDLVIIRTKLAGAVDDAVRLLDYFKEISTPAFSRKCEYLALSNQADYGIYDGDVTSNIRNGFPVKDYENEIDENVVGHSTAKHSSRSSNSFMVGSLARININKGRLPPEATTALRNSSGSLGGFNPYYNNLAQGIETIGAVEESLMVLDRLIDVGIEDKNTAVIIKAGRGSGAVEAPRGTLYHTYALDDEGRINYCNILTPTAQNLNNLEADARALLEQTANLAREERERLLEMLIRAYDPCITCSVH